jgi:hypothetical protein
MSLNWGWGEFPMPENPTQELGRVELVGVPPYWMPKPKYAKALATGGVVRITLTVEQPVGANARKVEKAILIELNYQDAAKLGTQLQRESLKAEAENKKA